MAVISIDTKEGKYFGVHLYYYKDNKSMDMKFNSRNFVRDWYKATRSFIATISQMDEDESNKVLSQSDSVSKFLFDQDPKKYKTAYLMIDAVGNPTLYYPLDDSYNERNKCRRGWEIFIPINNNWTWDEYKSYCLK